MQSSSFPGPRRSVPALKTARLTLAFPIIHIGMDVGHYLRWLSNDSTMQYSEQRHTVHTEESQRAYISSFQNSCHYFWEIQRTGVPIGSITAYINQPNKTANIGVMIGDSRLWGNGYAGEAWEGVAGFLFEEGTRKIEAGCMACNSAMISLLKRLHYDHEATIPGHFLRMGKPEDLVCYGKNREAKIFQLKNGNGGG